MKINDEGIALIKAAESCRLQAYRCPAGIWTVGYGHAGPDVYGGLIITVIEADAFFNEDLLKFDECVEEICPNATPDQHSAMVALCYNIGPSAFSRSSVARLHNAGRLAEAAQAFALWNKGGGQVLPGLVVRRAHEAALYLSDTPISVSVENAEGEKPLSQSRTINGQVAAGAATAGGAVLESAHDHLDQFQQIQYTFGTLAPYYHWALLAMAIVAMSGIAFGLYARWHDRDAGRS